MDALTVESLVSNVSTTLDDIAIKLVWESPCGCKCVPCCDLCIGELKLTAYRITLRVDSNNDGTIDGADDLLYIIAYSVAQFLKATIEVG